MTQYDLLKFKLGIKIRKEDDLSEFERGVAIGALLMSEVRPGAVNDHMCPSIHHVALLLK